MDVVLSEDMIGLEDVVVTGYTTMKRKDITGSVSSISADRIERIPAYNITTALTGIAGIRMDGVRSAYAAPARAMPATTR